MSDEICRCSHPKGFHQYSLGMGPCDFDGKCPAQCKEFSPAISDCLPLPALTLGEVASLFDAHPVTVARWRSSKNGLPEPDFVPAGNPKRALWAVATIVEWAESRGKEIDQAQLARIVGAGK